MTFKHKLGHQLRMLGDRIAPPQSTPQQHAPYTLTAPFFECLVRLGFSPQHIVDVGANHGHWTRTALNYFPNAKYSLFEPQEQLLRDSDLANLSNVSVYPFGVGARSGVMKLSTAHRDDSFSFALSEEQARAAGRPQIDATVVSLDAFLTENKLPSPDMLKIDAEGWDLEIVRGAEKCLRHADIVLMEAAVLCRDFPNTFALVVREMAERGYMLFDITDLNRTPKHGALWLVEVAFVRKSAGFYLAADSYV
jgi:FkbM family methyltransferase